MLALLLATAVATGPLEALAARLRASPAWQAPFTQRFLPAGFSTGSEERGVFTFAHPSRLRFDYTSDPRRTFAVDGAVARMVDEQAGSCQAVVLTEGSWAALPVAGLADPAALRQLFLVQQQEGKLVLVPEKPLPEVARVEIAVSREGLPAEVLVEDAQGNRNLFRFGGWRAIPAPAPAFFTPALPGSTPCPPP